MDAIVPRRQNTRERFFPVALAKSSLCRPSKSKIGHLICPHKLLIDLMHAFVNGGTRTKILQAATFHRSAR